jgi:hypothetical protein
MHTDGPMLGAQLFDFVPQLMNAKNDGRALRKAVVLDRVHIERGHREIVLVRVGR